MALALRSAFPLKTEIRLAQAVSEFEAGLDTRQKAAFRTTRSTARMNPPALKDVMQVTAEIDRQAHEKNKASRSFGPRFTNMLQSIQQYAALGDVVVGGSQSLIACGVWAAMSLGHLSFLEKLSELFMEAGRQAPRHNAMALIYPKSKALQNYLCEYYIVVVGLCQQIQNFNRKPLLGRMVSALDNSELKRLQSNLSKWSTSISGLVEVLLNENMMNETKQSSRTRELLSKWSDSEVYQRRLKTKARWLNACSTYEYQTTWKQTRKKGTSSLFSAWTEYQSWKHDPNSSAMLLSGKDTGELVTDDIRLTEDIREALLKGSNGMFLWVSLQLNAVCSEVSDHDIREALGSLPKDLNETYARILKNSARLDHRNRHVRLFKFVTAAFEPLDLDQMQDIMSVTAGDISWDPSKLINDIMSILKFCGSLVMIDEEEHTVRFVHHTARSFCLGSLGTSLYKTLPFTEIEAHRALGEATLTYLNYGIFDKQLSIRVIPNIDARRLPEQIVRQTVRSSRLASNLLKKKLGRPRDVGHILANLGSGPTTGNGSQDQHPFYGYAERFWLLQSRHVFGPNMRGLWDRLMKKSDASSVEVLSSTPHLAGLLSTALANISDVPAVVWALNYSHVFLFDHLMTSRENKSLSARLLMRRLILFRTYLKALSIQPVESIRLGMVSEMAWRLLPISIELGVYLAARRIIQWVSTDDILIFKEEEEEEDIERPLLLPSRSPVDIKIQRAWSHLAQNVALTKDVSMLRILVEERLISAEDKTRMIKGFIRSNVPQEVLLRACFIFTQAGIQLQSGDFELGYTICHHLASRDMVSSHVGSAALEHILYEAASIPNLVYTIFRQACAKGNFRVASRPWPSKFNLTTRANQGYSFQGDEIELALRTSSRDRSKIAHILLDDGKFVERLVHGPALKRAVALKHWKLAKRLVSLGADPEPLIKPCNEDEMLHHCVLAVDMVGLDFLLGIGMNVNQVSTGPTFSGCTPAEILAPASSWSRYHPLGKLIIPGVSPKGCSSGNSDPITGSDEQHLSEDVHGSHNSRSNLIGLPQFYGSSQGAVESDSSWVGKLAFVIAATMQRVVGPYFEPATNPSKQNITECLGHISELAIYISSAFARTGPSPSNYCEILWSLEKILGTIERLSQPPIQDWRTSPDPNRFMVQTMLFKLVDVILGSTMFINMEHAGTEFGPIWDEFCTILQRRPPGNRTFSFRSSSTAKSIKVRRDLQITRREGSFPWMMQCILLLTNDHSPSTLKTHVASTRDEWPHSQVVNASSSSHSLRDGMWGSREILRKLGCSEADAKFLYDNFGRYFYF
ncbi:nacht domain protein [Colletotrichum asianum]|uniref:Nacht domain protein n=1 Tax=Colletotrichum asianum TaxID=702518 RepID=A0A8H3W825_9PEZI|nr:nacht domain protein [Colletotrichum asianum]